MTNSSFKGMDAKRRIGYIGTAVRLMAGTWFTGSVFSGHLVVGPFKLLPWVTGLILLPATFFLWHRIRVQRHTSPLKVNGPVASVINIAIFLYFLFWTPSPISFMTGSVLLFYGVSMLIAAIRGYGGCEVLAISNWLLKRNDQLGCLFFSQIDYAERKLFCGHHKKVKDTLK